MNLGDLQKAIHRLYENNVDYKTSDDDDYQVRLGLINLWIGRWENVDNVLWSDLYKLWNSQSFTVGSTDYALPTDFKNAGGFVRLVKADGSYTQIPLISPDRAQVMAQADVYAYITGRLGGYTLSIMGVTDTTLTGSTIRLPYYKVATILSSENDITECPDPYFIVEGVVADLNSMSRNNSGYTLRLQQAETRLQQMQTRNELAAPWQDAMVPDMDHELYGSGFGY